MINMKGLVLIVMAMIAICSCRQHGQSERKEGVDSIVCESVHLNDEKPPIMTSIKTKYTWIDADGKEYSIYLMDTMCYIMKECEGCGKVFYKQLSKEIYDDIKSKEKADGWV